MDTNDSPTKHQNQQQRDQKQPQEQDLVRNLRLYLPRHSKLASLLCLYPVIFWLLNLLLFPHGRLGMSSVSPSYGLLLLGSSLFLILLTVFYTFSVRLVLERTHFCWRSGHDFRLHHSPYAAIRQLKAGEVFEHKQPIYDFVLVLHDNRPLTFSLNSSNSIRLVRALMRKDVKISPQLLQYFLYSHSRKSQLLQRHWGRVGKVAKIRGDSFYGRLNWLLHRHPPKSQKPQPQKGRDGGNFGASRQNPELRDSAQTQQSGGEWASSELDEYKS